MVKRTMLGAVLLAAAVMAAADEDGHNLLVFGNAHGLARTISTTTRFSRISARTAGAA